MKKLKPKMYEALLSLGTKKRCQKQVKTGHLPDFDLGFCSRHKVRHLNLSKRKWVRILSSCKTCSKHHSLRVDKSMFSFIQYLKS